MNNLLTFFTCVIGFRGFSLDDYGSVTTLKVLAFVRDYYGNIARGQSETCAKCSKSRNKYGNYHFENKFCFVRHTAYIKFGAKVQQFFDICKRERDFFLFFRIFEHKITPFGHNCGEPCG